MKNHSPSRAVPSGILDPAASRPAPAFGVLSRETRRSGFTLIEILACMGIFAIGFAAIAMMLPAGAVMQRDIEGRAMGDIVGRNALEVVKGKGVQSLTFDCTGTSIPMSTALNGGYSADATASWIMANNAQANWPAEFNLRMGFDMEAFYVQDYSRNWFILGYAQDNGPDNLYKYLDTNNNKGWYETNGSGSRLYMWNNPDLTHCGLGRIHALARRPMPGSATLFSMLDFSYPSTLFDITQRSHFAQVMKTNLSTSPFHVNYSGNGNFWAYVYSIASTHNWQLSVATLRANSGDEWPEQAEQNHQAGTNEPALATQAVASMTQPNCLSSNTPVYFRSRAGDAALQGLPDSAATKYWPWWPGNIGSGEGPNAIYDTTVTPYGGAPSNSCSWNRGWCVGWQGDLGGINTTIPPNTNSPCWNGFGKYITPPVADFSAKVPGRTTYQYRYPVPNLQACPVIVFDRANDLLLVRYPQVFANVNNTNVTGNTRLQNFWTDMGMTPGTAPDRRLKVGDSFLCAGWTTPFKVKELLDPATEYARLPAGVNKDAADTWSDGTYQVIRVTPSLSTTLYTANKPMQNRGPTMWDGPSPIMLLFAPTPVAGGASPWVSTLQRGNCNGGVFHNWDDLCN